MENSLKALMMAAEIIITCILVALGFYAANRAKEGAARSIEAASAYERRLAENSLTVYDGTVLSGSELVNLLRYELDRIREGKGTVSFFEVTTKSMTTLQRPEDLSKVTGKNSTEFISPYDAYIGEAVWKQGSLAGLRFTKK